MRQIQKSTLFTLFLFIYYFTCSTSSAQPNSREGYISVEGGRIWYKITGTGKGIPLLLIHGGPGSRSCEGIPVYSSLGEERPVIFYDQLGSGNSDRPTDTCLWKLPRFVSEITALRKALNLDEIHLMGSSWGAAIAVEYLLTQQPKGVKSVTFAGPLLSTPRWMSDANILLSQLPQQVQDTIQKYERLKQYDSPAYIAATDSFYVRYLLRKWGQLSAPAACESSSEFNQQVYQYMWGPTEFTSTGTLKNFDRTDRLHELKLPVLFVAGQYDEARPETMYEFQKKVKGAKVEIIKDSGHLKIIDNPKEYLKAIRNFLAPIG
ncbi:proline-specific peptidase [Flammeovirgaceae bacterium 311]|nr:proline-specific peptidase [Flammeovirgaceae bacterium 311]